MTNAIFHTRFDKGKAASCLPVGFCWGILLSVAVVLCGSLSAKVQPSALFSDHAVLLRSADTPVFGLAAPGEAVDVSLGSVQARDVAGKDGKWLVRLDLRKVGDGPFDLTINGKTSRDVLVGEVWLCSGQSNMAYRECDVDDIESERVLTNRLVRCFEVRGGVKTSPVDSAAGSWALVRPESTPNMSAIGYHFAKYLQEDLNRPVGFVVAAVGASTIEAWCDPETMKVDPRGKAELDRQIAFMDGYRAYEERCDAERRAWERSCGRLDRPHSAAPTDGWQSLTAEKAKSFTHSPGAIWLWRDVAGTPGRASVLARHRFIEERWHFDMSSFEVYWNGQRQTRRFSTDPVDKNSEYFDISAARMQETNTLLVRVFNAEEIPNVLYSFAFDGRRLPLAGWSVAEEFVLPSLTATEEKSMPPEQVFCLWQHYPTGLFNSQIAGLVPMGLSGVIWYQGESNARRAEAYRELFRTLILSWRKLFQKDDLPFAWCQLTGYLRKSASTACGSGWPEIRAAQDAALSLPMTGQVVLTDVGEADDIHPRDKRTPARRLANWALNRVYGRSEVPFLGPRVDGVETRGAALYVRFRDVDGGLRVHDLGTNYVASSRLGTTIPVRRNSPRADVEGFALAGADGIWRWADEATIEGNGVLVSSASVPHPVSVRYAWATNPYANLFNSDGLPAVPFSASVSVPGAEVLRDRVAVSDTNRFTCGSGSVACLSPDGTRILAPYLASTTGFGECHDLTALADIPCAHPERAVSFDLLKAGDVFCGTVVTTTVSYASVLRKDRVRVMVDVNFNMFGYRDWDPAKRMVSGEGLFKCTFEGRTEPLSPAAVSAYLTRKGLNGFDPFKEDGDRCIWQSRPVWKGGAFYGFVTSSCSQPILFKCADGETFEFVGVVPAVCEYECQLAIHKGLFYAVMRGAKGDNFWTSSDGGVTWKACGRLPDGQQRQQMLVWRDKVLIGYSAPDETPSKVRNGRNNLHLLWGEGPDLSTYREILHAVDPIGIVYPDLINVNGDLHILWSNSERFPTHVKWGAVQGKDQILHATLTL